MRRRRYRKDRRKSAFRKAQGDESFLPLGADSDAPALPEEIIYYDEQGAICRCLNWREAQRTMLTEETQAAVLVIESIMLNKRHVAHRQSKR